MKEMKVKDFDDYSYPKRRPWLAVILIVLAVFFVVQRQRGRKQTEEQEEIIATSVTTKGIAEEITADAVEKGKVATEQPSPIEFAADVDQLLISAKKSQAGGDLVAARRKYLEILRRLKAATSATMSPSGRLPRTGDAKGGRLPAIGWSARGGKTEVEKSLAAINIDLVLTPRAMPEKVEYIVRRGDSVEKIARKFGTTVESIQKSNRLKNPNLIKAGDRLRVLRGKFAITISKARNDLLLSMNGEFFKRYRVGTGIYDKTPGGTFTIAEKIKEPVWWRPDGKEVPYGDKENILGTRWMSLRAAGDTPDVRGYGIHGTWDNNTVGKSVSAGCIRLTNSDVEELFLLAPLGTAVTITE